MNAEKLAYWFFRLNGCFTFENFIVHPDRRGAQETDADLIALRFQHRSELHTSNTPMQDHPLFTEQPKLINVFLVEAKRGACSINGPWKKPKRRNLQRVLFAMGFVPKNRVDEVANHLYEHLSYTDDLMTIRFTAVGRERSKRGTVAKALQLTWHDILQWIHKRFNEYKAQKADHDQWDDSAKQLYDTATQEYPRDVNGFIEHWLSETQIGG